jgi:hypothetical protein
MNMQPWSERGAELTHAGAPEFPPGDAQAWAGRGWELVRGQL